MHVRPFRLEVNYTEERRHLRIMNVMCIMSMMIVGGTVGTWEGSQDLDQGTGS